MKFLNHHQFFMKAGATSEGREFTAAFEGSPGAVGVRRDSEELFTLMFYSSAGAGGQTLDFKHSCHISGVSGHKLAKAIRLLVKKGLSKQTISKLKSHGSQFGYIKGSQGSAPVAARKIKKSGNCTVKCSA